MKKMNHPYTKVPNELMEVLLSPALNDSERRVMLFITRKTSGWQKKEDAISLTQFQNKLGLSRQAVVNALKNLLLVKLIRLVKKGNSKKAPNIYTFDLSDYESKLVKLGGLVKHGTGKLVKHARHTKESITKESLARAGNNTFPDKEKAWETLSPSLLQEHGIADPEWVSQCREEYLTKGRSKSSAAIKAFIARKLEVQPPDPNLVTDVWAHLKQTNG